MAASSALPARRPASARLRRTRPGWLRCSRRKGRRACVIAPARPCCLRLDLQQTGEDDAAQGTDARRVAPARCRAWIPQREVDRRRATGHVRHAEARTGSRPGRGLKPWSATGFMSTATAAVPGRRFPTGRCRYGLRLLSASPGPRPEMQLASAGSHEVMLREHQAACRASEARAQQALTRQRPDGCRLRKSRFAAGRLRTACEAGCSRICPARQPARVPGRRRVRSQASRGPGPAS